MAKLEVLENKKLVLKNVLVNKLRGISFEDVDKEISKFVNKLNILNVKMFGPLVIKSYGTNIHEDGTITTDYDLIVQAHDYKQYKSNYYIQEKYECPHCVYIHYEGVPEDVNYATIKLDLYFYENELESNGEMYSVYIHDSEDYIVTDFFRPVIQT